MWGRAAEGKCLRMSLRATPKRRSRPKVEHVPCHVRATRCQARLDGLHRALRGSLPLLHCLSQLVPELHEEAAKLVAAGAVPAHTPDVVVRRVLHQGRLPGGQ